MVAVTATVATGLNAEYLLALGDGSFDPNHTDETFTVNLQDGRTVIFTGENFAYDPFFGTNAPYQGTVHTVTFKASNGSNQLAITGLNIDVTDFAVENEEDAQVLLEQIFAGADTFNGSAGADTFLASPVWTRCTGAQASTPSSEEKTTTNSTVA